MPKLKRILHPTDFSEESNTALLYALDLAEAVDAELHVVHVVTSRVGYADSTKRQRDDELRDELESLVQQSQEAAGHSETNPIEVGIVQANKAAEGILRYAKDHGIDLIVPGTHGRRGVRHLILGSVMESIARNATIPVLAVRPRKKPTRELEHVLVPIDFSDFSKGALHYAKHVASLSGARVSLLFVAEERTVPLFSDTGIPNFTVLKMEGNVIENAPAALQSLDSNVQVDSVHTDYLIREGSVDQMILQAAGSEDADLIVMGAHGIGSSGRRALGNTTAHVLRSSSTPVLVIPNQYALAADQE